MDFLNDVDFDEGTEAPRPKRGRGTDTAGSPRDNNGRVEMIEKDMVIMLKSLLSNSQQVRTLMCFHDDHPIIARAFWQGGGRVEVREEKKC